MTNALPNTQPNAQPNALPTRTDVLIAGGGPAGALLGCLLARRGIDVTVVEKQRTLERDFRGETLAAASALTLRALGFGPALDEVGYLETHDVTIQLEGRPTFTVDYSRSSVDALPIDIPQPTLIGLFLDEARRNPSFRYLTETSVVGLAQEDGKVTGAVLRASDGTRATVRSSLVVGADGRFSRVRKAAGLEPEITPMERDFLSFKLPRPADWGSSALLVVDGDKHLVILPTFPDFLRVGCNLPKRGLGDVRSAGFEAFKAQVIELEPRLAPLMEGALTSWDDTGFLEIFTAELGQWSKDGLVLIGDASHTCTPILGQGVNLAIQDCVALTPVIAEALAVLPPGEVLPAATFADFEVTRRKAKQAVTKFQRMQEGALAAGTPVAIFMRRLRYRVLNRLPIKNRMFDRVLSARPPIDPADLRPGAGIDVTAPVTTPVSAAAA